MAKRARSAKRRLPEPRTCKDATALLADYVAGTLPAKTRRAFEDHLRLCPDCVSFLRTYRKTIELARSFLERSLATADLAGVERELKSRLQKKRRSR